MFQAQGVLTSVNIILMKEVLIFASADPHGRSTGPESGIMNDCIYIYIVARAHGV